MLRCVPGTFCTSSAMKNNRHSPGNAAGRSRELREVTGTWGLLGLWKSHPDPGTQGCRFPRCFLRLCAFWTFQGFSVLVEGGETGRLLGFTAFPAWRKICAAGSWAGKPLLGGQ